MTTKGPLKAIGDYALEQTINMALDLTQGFEVFDYPINKNELHNSVTQNIEQNALGSSANKYYGNYGTGEFNKYGSTKSDCGVIDNNLKCE